MFHRNFKDVSIKFQWKFHVHDPYCSLPSGRRACLDFRLLAIGCLELLINLILSRGVESPPPGMWYSLMILNISVSLAPTSTCQPSLNLAWIPAWAKATTVFDFCMYVRDARIAYHLKINHLLASDHKTSLPKYYPLTLGNLRQLLNDHMSMQHSSWRQLSISVIPQLLLTRFWQNFKVSFQDHHQQMPTITMKFVQVTFDLRTYVNISDTSAVTELILTKLQSLLSVTIFNRCQLQQWHLSRQYLTWRLMSISAIFQLLLNQFWQNFRFKFLELSLTDVI